MLLVHVKKTSIVVMALICISGLNAMEQVKDLSSVIHDNDLRSLKIYIEECRLDPNRDPKALPGFDESRGGCFFSESLLSYAAVWSGAEVITYLLNLASDKVVLLALKAALSSYRGDRGTERSVAEQLIMAEAIRRNLNIESARNQALAKAASLFDLERAHCLIGLGADRTSAFLIAGLNHILQNAHCQEEYHAASNMITLLRTYAPDLKTCTALNILNQVREGILTAEDFTKKPLTQDTIELIAKLARVDPEAQEKWVAIGI